MATIIALPPAEIRSPSKYTLTCWSLDSTTAHAFYVLVFVSAFLHVCTHVIASIFIHGRQGTSLCTVRNPQKCGPEASLHCHSCEHSVRLVPLATVHQTSRTRSCALFESLPYLSTGAFSNGFQISLEEHPLLEASDCFWHSCLNAVWFDVFPMGFITSHFLVY